MTSMCVGYGEQTVDPRVKGTRRCAAEGLRPVLTHSP